jgi:hypothetical protein
MNTVVAVGSLATLARSGALALNRYAGLLRVNARFNNFVKSGSSFFAAISKKSIGKAFTAFNQRMGRFVGWGASGAGRFIARSGSELETWLNKLYKFPKGVVYKGNLYRSIGKQYNNPLEIHQGSINANYRYSKPGEGGLYFSKSLSGNITEITTYGDLKNYKTYEYIDIKIDNMLDLTDDLVLKELGVNFDLLTRNRVSNNLVLDQAFNYEFTHKIGTWASSKGYKGIIFPGARGNKDYLNVVFFNKADIDNAFSKIVPKVITH